jgi:hypothetical protein
VANQGVGLDEQDADIGPSAPETAIWPLKLSAGIPTGNNEEMV